MVGRIGVSEWAVAALCKGFMSSAHSLELARFEGAVGGRATVGLMIYTHDDFGVRLVSASGKCFGLLDIMWNPSDPTYIHRDLGTYLNT